MRKFRLALAQVDVTVGDLRSSWPMTKRISVRWEIGFSLPRPGPAAVEKDGRSGR